MQIGGGFEYALNSGEWEVRFGITPSGRWKGRAGQRPHSKLLPKLYLGNREIEFTIQGKTEGQASQTQGVRLQRMGIDVGLEYEQEIARWYLTDFVPGGQIARILEPLKALGADPLSIQRITLYGQIGATASFYPVFEPPPVHLDAATLAFLLGLKAAYEPDLILAKGSVYVGGGIEPTFQIAPNVAFNKITGKLYGGVTFTAFAIKIVDEKFVFLNYSYPSAQLKSLASDNLAESEWLVFRVVPNGKSTIDRGYLKSGGEGFALASEPVRAKSVLSANGSMLSPLEAFRLMKQSPVAKSGVAVQSKGGATSPQLSQAELPIITNAFPYSEPTLAGYGQELMLLWVADNANTNDLQYADIRWSRFDGTDWSAPTSIVTDTRADFAPKVAFDGNGDAVAVWQKVTDPNFTNANLSAMAAEMEIVWSRWDRASGIWSTPSAMTTNTYYDGSPLLAGPLTNGDLLVTWTKNEANLLMGTGTVGAAENDVVLCSRWSAAAHAWTAPEVVVSNLAYRLSQSFAGISNRAVYAWTTDADGVLTNDTDQEVFYRYWQDDAWQVVTRLTTDTNADKSVRVAVSPTVATNQNTVSAEGFETGDFTRWPWTFEGNAAWAVQGSTVYSGTFSAASGGITHNQSSTMKVVVSCPSGTVSFAYKVSSEGNYDFLRFYIDGNQQSAWSGSAGWSIASYPISAGQHTLQWSYTKDSSISSGSDKAWVDSISIPGRESRGVYLVWQRDQNLVSDRDFAGDPRSVRPDSGSAGFADYAMTYGPQGNMVLLWQEMTTNGSDAHYSVYDPTSDTWSKDATFFNDSPLERSFSPVWDSSGQLNFAYNKVEIVITNETVELEGGGSVTVSNVPQQGRVDVAVAVRRLITDVAILPGGFTVEGANYLPGDALTLSAMLRNVGDVAVSNAAVSFYEGNPASGGVLITNLAWSGWLEGAATNAILTTVWVVPEPATNRTLYAVANPAQAFTEFVGNNNTQAVNIGGVDLSVSMLSATAETNGSMRVIAQVQNIGAPGATNTTLALRRQGLTGTPLATVEVPALEPGLLAQVALDLPDGTQPEGEAFYTLTVDDKGIIPDVETNNNTSGFSVNLWMDSDNDGIPNWWMTNNFGHAVGQADDNSLADQDADGDGMNNYAEWRAGTNPRCPCSYLVVREIASLGTNSVTGGFLLTWGSVSNKFYTIDRATDLVNGVGFSPIQQHILATPPVNTYQDTSVTTNSGPFFYRIVVE